MTTAGDDSSGGGAGGAGVGGLLVSPSRGGVGREGRREGVWVGGVQDEMTVAVWNPHGVGGGGLRGGGGCLRGGVEWAAADLSGRIWVGFLFSSMIFFPRVRKCSCIKTAMNKNKEINKNKLKKSIKKMKE